MHIVGTAGHVDHGKSALIISLTGHDPDRWLAEQQRGMTLDLGFAPLSLSGGIEAGVIDVPGHGRFMHNMLAGAAGMELLLLVVAANEGPRPQTREHLQILNFLNVSRAIIVLTKSDLVDEDSLDIATALTRDACENTVAAQAPLIAVSNKTGHNIDALKLMIGDALASLPARPTDAPAFMPIDRVFALQGHGTVITGTLMQGVIRCGDILQLQPSGLSARVRSLHVFGQKMQSVSSGSRVAVNVPGIGTNAIARGEVLVATSRFEPTSGFPLTFTPLPEARQKLRRRMRVRAHIGSAEITGRLQLESLDPASASLPGSLELARPTACYPGSRLVLRGISPKTLLGGAVVSSRSGTRSDASPYDRILQTIEHSGLDPLGVARIISQANVSTSTAENVLRQLLDEQRVDALQRPLEYISRPALDKAVQSLLARLLEEHAKAPWRAGFTSATVADLLQVGDQVANRLLGHWHDRGLIGHTARFWHLPDFVPRFSPQQLGFFKAALYDDAGHALLPRSFQLIAESIRKARVPGLEEAFDSMLSTGSAVRIGDDLYNGDQISHAKDLLVAMLHRVGAATMSQVRDALGTSRKHALPLMEFFDGAGLTVRDGDLRRLRRPPS